LRSINERSPASCKVFSTLRACGSTAAVGCRPRFVVITGPLPPKKLPAMLRQRELQCRAMSRREQMQQKSGIEGLRV